MNKNSGFVILQSEVSPYGGFQSQKSPTDLEDVVVVDVVFDASWDCCGYKEYTSLMNALVLSFICFQCDN